MRVITCNDGRDAPKRWFFQPSGQLRRPWVLPFGTIIGANVPLHIMTSADLPHASRGLQSSSKLENSTVMTIFEGFADFGLPELQNKANPFLRISLREKYISYLALYQFLARSAIRGKKPMKRHTYLRV